MQSNRPAQIPTGTWQLAIGGIAVAIGIFAALAAAGSPLGDASATATAAVAFAIATTLLIWGMILRYLSLIEAKIDRLLRYANEGWPTAAPGAAPPIRDAVISQDEVQA